MAEEKKKPDNYIMAPDETGEPAPLPSGPAAPAPSEVTPPAKSPELGQPETATPHLAGSNVPAGEPAGGKEAYRAELRNFGEKEAANRASMLALNPNDPDYLKKLAAHQAEQGLLREGKAHYQQSHPWGSMESAHPGMFGKIGHAFGNIANAVGTSVLGPGTMATIPGTKANMAARETEGQSEIKAAGEQAGQAATTASTEAEVPLRKAQTKEAEANAAAKENPPEKEQPYVLHETEKGIFGVNPKTGEAVPLTYGGEILQPTAKPDANKLAGEIAAQVGEKPTTPEYAGQKYPSVAEAQAAWGKAAEAIKNREAAAGAAARGESFGRYRPVAAIDPKTGEVKYMFAGEAISGGAAPAGAGAKAMSQGAQFSEMKTASQNMRNAIANLDRPFTPEQIGKLTYALHQGDQGLFRNEIDTLLGSQQLTPAQQDLVVWMAQLNERALSLRSVAGMGQGSDELRHAIRATLPGVKSGSKELMVKQLNAFDNQVALLEKGIPKVKGQEQSSTGGNQRFIDNGRTYNIPADQVEAFKRDHPNAR